jgi:hypothetical protein
VAEQPFRERRFSPEEVQQVVRRAVDLAGIESNASAGPAMTAEELASRLGQLGVSDDVIRRAMPTSAPAPSTGSDGWLRIDRSIELEGELSNERFETIMEAIQAVMKMPGRASVVGNTLTWTPGGAMVEPSVTVRVRDGTTTIHYLETLGHEGRAKIGFGVLSGLGASASGVTTLFAGAGIAKAADISSMSGAAFVLAFAALATAATAVGSFTFLRRSFTRRRDIRTKFAEEVMSQVSLAVERAIGEEYRRIRVQPPEAERIEELARSEHEELESPGQSELEPKRLTRRD